MPTLSGANQIQDTPSDPSIVLGVGGLQSSREAAHTAHSVVGLSSALLQALPAAVYTTDAAGRITYYNEEAAALWGCRPELGKSEFCGSWKLYYADGRPMPHDQCPMAQALRERRAIRGREAIAERPDGTRIPFIPYPTPLFDDTGTFVGAVNMLVDISERKRSEASLAKHRDQEAALHKFTDRLYRAESRRHVYDAALDAIGQALGCDRASILLFDATGTMRFVAWRGLSDKYRRAVEGHSPWTRDAADPQPMCIDDVGRADMLGDLKKTVHAEGIGALSFIPLVANGKLIGKFMTYYRTPHAFSDADIDLAVTIARQLGFSLERISAEEARRRAEQELREGEARYRSIFQNARVAVWEQDFSGVVTMLEELRADGITDLRIFFEDNPARLAEAVERVRVKDVNDFTVELFEAGDKAELLKSLADVFLPETQATFVDELLALWEGRRRFESEAVVRTLKGRRLDVLFTMAFEGARCEHTLVSLLDISARKAAEQRLETVNQVARTISGELDLSRVVQVVTDSATKLSGAKFGAFFYNVINERGESYLLYTLSGAPREAFEKFGIPRNTAVFEPTFRGTGVVRSNDIRKDPRYGKNSPHLGMPKGHLPVVSYLAVPVVSRSGEVQGGLFFGHDQPGVFTQEAEELIFGIASHAAIAIDNARLFQSARLLGSIVETSEDAILSMDLSAVIMSWNRGAERLFGYTQQEAIGQPITMLIPPKRQHEEPRILNRIRNGERVEHYETVRMHKDGSAIDVSLSVSPIKDAFGGVIGASKIARDVTERKQAQMRQDLLNREIHHRTKNLFSVVQSVVTRSFAGKRTVEEAQEAVISRLHSLSQTHAMLIDRKWQGADIAAVVRSEMRPYGDRVVIQGPRFILNAKAAQNFALALHELATNAVKYGALSNATGRVHIKWAVDSAGTFAFQWQELGGPPVKPPEHKGFGSVVLEQVMAEFVDKPPQFNFMAEGLSYRLVGSLDSVTLEEDEDARGGV